MNKIQPYISLASEKKIIFNGKNIRSDNIAKIYNQAKISANLYWAKVAATFVIESNWPSWNLLI